MNIFINNELPNTSQSATGGSSGEVIILNIQKPF